MKTTPGFVLADGKMSADWIEEQDLLTFPTFKPFNMRNQVDYWRKNDRIRQAIKEIKQEVKLLIKSNKQVNPGMASWIEISRRAGCDRKSLIYDRALVYVQRKTWVSNLRNKLVELINDSINKSKANESIPVPTEKVNLESQIQNLRMTIAKLYNDLQMEKNNNEELTRLLRKYGHF